MQSLKPLDFKEDVEKYQAKEIKTEVLYPHCNHKQIKLNETRTELRCVCGIAFSGPRLGELQQLFTHIS